MIHHVRQYVLLVIAMVSVATTSAKEETVDVLSDYDFFLVPITNGNSTVDAFFTVTNASKKEVMIGYDNFYYEADVASPSVPNINDNIVDGSFVTAIPKTTVGTITIPSTVTGTDGLTYTVTGIANHAFAECKLLTSVTIPNTINDIDTYAFNLCTGLNSLTVDINTPLTVSESTFDGCYGATLYVPKGQTKAYASANYWKLFNAISEMGGTTLRGDVNLDGEVNIQDVVAMISYILGTPTDPFSESNADLDGNDDINITDATALINLILER